MMMNVTNSKISNIVLGTCNSYFTQYRCLRYWNSKVRNMPKISNIKPQKWEEDQPHLFGPKRRKSKPIVAKHKAKRMEIRPKLMLPILTFSAWDGFVSFSQYSQVQSDLLVIYLYIFPCPQAKSVCMKPPEDKINKISVEKTKNSKRYNYIIRRYSSYI